MNSQWRINLLGGLSAQREGRELRRFQTSKASILLGTLAYDLQSEHPRDDLQESIWPDADALGGRRCLSQALYTLRLQLEPPGTPAGSVIISNHTYVRLNPSAVTTDVADFVKMVGQGEHAADQSERIGHLEKALDLYQGELLPGYYEDWVLVERERLAAMLARSLRQAVRDFEEEGDLDRALEYALRAVRATPTREEVHYDVVRLQMAMGQHDEAMQRYQRLRRLLRREEGRKPSPATQALIEPLALKTARGMVGDTSYAVTRRREAAYLRHSPVQQADRERYSSPRPAESPSAPAIRLPLTLTRFFGRDTEVSRLLEMLAPPSDQPEGSRTSKPSHRLVTLLGPGGSGKTRLAVEVARRLADSFQNAVYFVPLADLTKADGIADCVREALSIERSMNTRPLDQVVKALSGRKALLVLDNAEHLIDSTAQFVWTILEKLPEVSCLVTSRQSLGLNGEQEFAVQTFAVPTKPGTPDRLMEFACVQLFVDRAQAVCPDFQITPRNAPAVAAICQHLEGIPLAIELAAARTQVLTPVQMLAQLSDRFGFLVSRRRAPIEARHRTLREAIEWSYQLLPSELQRFFTRLSVFRGGWTLGAAERVCEEPQALDFLEQLVHRSLVTTDSDTDEIRFRMLETIREYATDQLDAEEKSAVAARHADYFCRLAENAALYLRGRDMQPWLERLDAEHENLRVALERSVTTELGLRLAGALSRFWLIRGYVDEGRKSLLDTLSLCQSGSPAARATALLGAGALAHDQGDYEAARLCFEESMALSHEASDSRGIAEAYSNLGILECAVGDPSRARSLHEESVNIWRMLDDQWGVAGELNNLGRVAQSLGDYKTASRCYRESRYVYEQSGDWPHAAIALNNLGAALFEQGELEDARIAYETGLELFRQLGNRPWTATLQNNLGEVLLMERDLASARRLLFESLRTRNELGDRAGVVSTLVILANLARAEDDPVRAARLFAVAESLRLSVGLVPSPTAREVYDRDITAVRLALGNSEFLEAWSEGRALPLDKAIAYALEEPAVESVEGVDSLTFVN